MKTILDTSILFISEEKWNSDSERDLFLSHLLYTFDFAQNNPSFRIVWTDALYYLMWNSYQPWKENRSEFIQMTRILIDKIDKFTHPIEHEFDRLCILEPELEHSYGDEPYQELIKIIDTINHHEDTFILALGVSNSHMIGQSFNLACTEEPYLNKIIPIFKWDASSELDFFMANAIIPQNWNYKDDPFPAKDFCSSEYFIINSPKTSDVVSERVHKAIKLGIRIAHINGYEYSPSLSKKNSFGDNKRHIFIPKHKSCDTYLSLDTKTVAFEVYDKSKKHLGEWNFQGIKIDKDDTKGSHDIIT